MVFAIASGEPRQRLVGLLALAYFVAFVVTPQNLVVRGRPALFNPQVRLAASAFAVGLLLLPIVFSRRARWVLSLYAVTLVVTQIDPAAWPTGFHWGAYYGRVGFSDAVWGAGVLAATAGLALGVRLAFRRHLGLARVPIALALLTAAVVGLACVHSSYLDGRYADLEPLEKVYAWPRRLHGARIAMIGLFMQNQYPMAGADLSNHVQYAGVRTAHGGYRSFASCTEWVDFLLAGRYDYAVVGFSNELAGWTARQPGSTVVLAQQLGASSATRVTVFRLALGPVHRC